MALCEHFNYREEGCRECEDEIDFTREHALMRAALEKIACIDRDGEPRGVALDALKMVRVK